MVSLTPTSIRLPVIWILRLVRLLPGTPGPAAGRSRAAGWPARLPESAWWGGRVPAGPHSVGDCGIRVGCAGGADPAPADRRQNARRVPAAARRIVVRPRRP